MSAYIFFNPGTFVHKNGLKQTLKVQQKTSSFIIAAFPTQFRRAKTGLIMFLYMLSLHIYILFTGLGREIQSSFITGVIPEAASCSCMQKCPNFRVHSCRVSLNKTLLYKQPLSQYNSIRLLLLLVEYD